MGEGTEKSAIRCFDFCFDFLTSIHSNKLFLNSKLHVIWKYIEPVEYNIIINATNGINANLKATFRLFHKNIHHS